MVALDAGLSRSEVTALGVETPVRATFSDARELALLAWVDLVAVNGPVADEARTAIRAHFADHEVVELTTLVDATFFTAFVDRALRDEGTSAHSLPPGRLSSLDQTLAAKLDEPSPPCPSRY